MRRWPLLPLLATLLLVVPAASGNHVDPFEVIKVLEVGDIPTIFHPTFADEDYLPDDERVIGVAIQGDARAYPLKIMNWHEVVNDTVGGVPVAITYCPLCGTGAVYDRRVDGQALTLTVSGKLYKSNLVMFDNQTRSYWSQVTGEAILGPLHGARLEWIPSSTLPWGDWKARHPDSLLLEPPLPQCEGGRTGDDCRDYTRDPYRGYRESTVVYSDFGGEYTDTILHPKTEVLGIDVRGVSMAYPFPAMNESRVVHDVLNRQPLVVTFLNGSLQAFDPAGRSFVPAPDPYMVDENGTRWHRGTGVSEAGDRLPRVEALPSFWFAWTEFHPGTGVYDLRPPSVLTFELRAPGEVRKGDLLRQELRFANTANLTLDRVQIRVELPPALEYVEDGATALSSFRDRSVSDGSLVYGFGPVGPGEASFAITSRVPNRDLPGVVFKSQVSIEYEDPDGRTITASKPGESFRVQEAEPFPWFLLLGLVAVPPAVWFLLRRRTATSPREGGSVGSKSYYGEGDSREE